MIGGEARGARGSLSGELKSRRLCSLAQGKMFSKELKWVMNATWAYMEQQVRVFALFA